MFDIVVCRWHSPANTKRKRSKEVKRSKESKNM